MSARDEVVVASRFQGPPDCANGGYACGLLATRMPPGPLRVTLRRPVPLGQTLSFKALEAGGLALLMAPGDDGTPPESDALVLAVPAGALEVGVIPRMTLARVREAVLDEAIVRTHPFPGCFGCGPDRDPSEAVALSPQRLQPGLYATAWMPGGGLPQDTDGVLAPEAVWAALDCPSSFAAVPAGSAPHVLGRIEGEVRAPVHVGEEVIVVSWALGGEGRKRWSGCALLGSRGEVRALARATWVALA